MKVKAFTILELVVVLLITAIVLSIGYGGYLMLQKTQINRRNDQNSAMEISRLRHILNHEIYFADEVMWNAEESRLNFSERSSMTFGQEYCIYSNGISDTLKLEFSEIKPRVVRDYSSNELVERVDVFLHNLNAPITVSKKYTEYKMFGL